MLVPCPDRNAGLQELIDPVPSRPRDLVTAMLVAQVIAQGSKLPFARGLRTQTATSSLGELLGVASCDEDDLYAAMDWALARKDTIENTLAARHLAKANGAARQRLAIREGPESMQNPATADSHGDFTCRVRIRHLDILGYRIRTATWPADAEHTPLLMFNGMGTRLELLDPLAQALAGIEIIFDVPGSGESPTPWLPYTLPMLATLTGATLTKLGYEQVDVFGLSCGGMLAQQFAFQNPHRCRRLILAATMPGTPMAPARLSTLLKVATPRRFNDPAYARRIAGRVYGGAARRQPPPPLHQQGGRTSRLGYLLEQLAVTGWSSHLLLPTLRQPTLILAGDDPIVPLVNACWMACLIPRSRLHILHDGHHFFRSSTNETASAIRDFLDGPHPVHGS